jgi:hypothetical protein
MVQVAKSTKDFELFEGLNPGSGQGKHRKLKSRSDFSQMRHFRTRNCRVKDNNCSTKILHPRSGDDKKKYVARWSLFTETACKRF